jgi:hypothetical protein
MLPIAPLSNARPNGNPAGAHSMPRPPSPPMTSFATSGGHPAVPEVVREAPPTPAPRSTSGSTWRKLASRVGLSRLVETVGGVRDPAREAMLPAPPKLSAMFERSPAQGASRLGDVLGFAWVWLMTTGAGAIVAGHLMARSPSTVIVKVPAPVSTSASGSADPAPQASCAQPWQPPVIAVSDLPSSPVPRSIVRSRGLHHRPVARPRDAEAPAPMAWGEAPRHAHPPDGVVVASRAIKAKASPKSLGDWMRAAVDSN